MVWINAGPDELIDQCALTFEPFSVSCCVLQTHIRTLDTIIIDNNYDAYNLKTVSSKQLCLVHMCVLIQ